MEMTFQPQEAAVLKRVLSDYLSDLRMEICNTEDYDLRQELKQDEVVIKVMIARLAEAQVPSA